MTFSAGPSHSGLHLQTLVLCTRERTQRICRRTRVDVGRICSATAVVAGEPEAGFLVATARELYIIGLSYFLSSLSFLLPPSLSLSLPVGIHLIMLSRSLVNVARGRAVLAAGSVDAVVLSKGWYVLFPAHVLLSSCTHNG